MAPKRVLKGTAVERVANYFGGFAQLGAVLGISREAVQLWNTDRRKNRRGRDGRIPDAYHDAIMEAARKRRIKQRAEELVNV